MAALDSKLMRDLWQMRGQALAIILVMACGVGLFIMALSLLASLQRNMDSYYSQYRFAEVFASLKRAPDALKPRIAEIPGVAHVQTRISEYVTLDMPDLNEPATGRIVSIPDHGDNVLGLNDVYLRLGRFPEPERSGEVVVSEAFAKAHKFLPGDSIDAVINGRKQKLTIVGIGLSPEFIYQIRPGDILPDDRRFGIFWMRYQQLAAAFDMQGAFNDVSLTMLRGASRPDIISRLDRLLASYGGLGAYDRKDHPSHQFISNEMRELRSTAMMVPIIFLIVASFLLNVVLSRLISTQREQIATLKAFGYTKFEIGMHYFKMVAILVLLGVLAGTVLGGWLGRTVTAMYTRFFNFPTLQYYLDLRVGLIGAFACGGAALVGTMGSVLRAVHLQPAEAMRPEPPASFRPTLIERIGLQRFVPVTARMILRNLERRPGRALFSCIGIAMAVAVLILGSFMLDAIDYAMESQFFVAQRQDMTVTFVEPTSGEVLHDLEHLPGVQYCEPFRSVPARLRAGHRSRRTGITGVIENAHLNRLRDVYRRPVSMPPEGLVVSTKLAQLLDIKVGDLVTIEVLEGERPVRDVPLTGTIDDFSGLAAYMNLAALQRLMGEGDAASGAYLTVDEMQVNTLYRKLKEAPRIAGVAIKMSTLNSFRATIAENLTIMITFNILFSTIIAGGVVYNTARISLSERSRELATLRVLGFTQGEIAMILLGELGTLTLLSIPLGMLMGFGLAFSVITNSDTELFRIPLVIDTSTFAMAATVTCIASVLSGWIVVRKVGQLDLVAVLKSKE